MKNIYVSKSRNGQGLFVKNKFYKSEKILKISGRYFKVREEQTFDNKTISNSFRFDENNYIDPSGELGDFLNHSCSPNCAVSKEGNDLYLVALKDIHKDSEIFIDYSTIIAKDDNWVMNCNCGEFNCRKTIFKFDLLPKNLKEYYLISKAVPEYILNIC